MRHLIMTCSILSIKGVLVRGVLTTVGEAIGIALIFGGLLLVAVPVALIFLGAAFVFLSVSNAR